MMGTVCSHVHRVSRCIAWAVEQGGERHCFLPFWKFSQRKADPDPASCIHRVSSSQPLNFLWTPTLLGLPSHFGIHFFSDSTFYFWDSHPFWPPVFFWPFTPFQPPTPFQALCSELAEQEEEVQACCHTSVFGSAEFLSFLSCHAQCRCPFQRGADGGAHGPGGSRLPMCIQVTPRVCRATFEHLHVKHLNQPDLHIGEPSLQPLII